MFPSEVDSGYYVGYVRALSDQTRFAIDHGVIDLAFVVVLRVCWLNHAPAHLAFELNYIFLFHVFLRFLEIHHGF
jgi:hypothetical protein